MLKVVVFDSGYGGEFFADQLEAELPILEVIRVIDWRHAEQIIKSPKAARKLAAEALRPYIGRVDLIIFANHLLTMTSLRFFRRKFRNQKFIGMSPPSPGTFIKRDILVLTTKAVSRTLSYRRFIFRLHRHIGTLALDTWPLKIDDGELSETEIHETITHFIIKSKINPQEIILMCSQFDDIKSELRRTVGCNIRIYDSFTSTIRQVYKTLNLRGRTGKK